MARTVGTRSSRKRSAFGYTRSVLAQVWHHPSNADRRLRALGRAVAWQVYKRVTGRSVTARFGDYRIICRPDSGSATNVIYFTDRFDPVEQRFMEAYLRPGDAFADVGANIGLYSLWAAGYTAPDGAIDAYEAAPRAAAHLREHLDLNDLTDRIRLREAAAGSAAGSVEFLVDFDVSNRMLSRAEAQHDDRRSVAVEAVRLDEDLPHPSYALAKLDVEGAELMVLEGLEQRLRRGDPAVLFVELLPSQLEKQATTVDEVATLLAAHGYRFVEFDDRGLTLHPLDDPNAVLGNVIAVAESAMPEVTARLDASRAQLTPR